MKSQKEPKLNDILIALGILIGAAYLDAKYNCFPELRKRVTMEVVICPNAVEKVQSTP